MGQYGKVACLQADRLQVVFGQQYRVVQVRVDVERVAVYRAEYVVFSEKRNLRRQCEEVEANTRVFEQRAARHVHRRIAEVPLGVKPQHTLRAVEMRPFASKLPARAQQHALVQVLLRNLDATVAVEKYVWFVRYTRIRNVDGPGDRVVQPVGKRKP
ncbi:hypothetical protein ACFPTO_16515 [Paraburkholderia denitrificans]|uniref:Uncharacterized protein n=1 Tax=Paraburkholderia denitrificans TaxID=694025 RepID=A0ABW0JBX1_9BURK